MTVYDCDINSDTSKVVNYAVYKDLQRCWFDQLGLFVKLISQTKSTFFLCCILEMINERFINFCKITVNFKHKHNLCGVSYM